MKYYKKQYFVFLQHKAIIKQGFGSNLLRLGWVCFEDLLQADNQRPGILGICTWGHIQRNSKINLFGCSVFLPP